MSCINFYDCTLCLILNKIHINTFPIREGTFFLGGGGLGPQRGGSSVKVSTKRGGPYLM